MPKLYPAKYKDAKAVAAMGALADDNPLNHDRFTDAEAEAAALANAGIADAISKKHTQGTDADLDPTFEATFAKKADTATRKIWLPASVFKIGYKTPSEGVIGQLWDNVPYWALDDTINEGVGTTFYFPINISGNIILRAFWGMETAVEGDVYPFIASTPIAEGEDMEKARAYGGAIITVPETAKTLKISDIYTVSSTTKKGKMNRITFWRYAGSGDDTAAGDLLLLGVQVEYTEQISAGE